MDENLAMALEIMWKGFVGVFVVIILLSVVVWLLAKAGTKK